MDGLGKWDVFISYAHEDYEAVAAPLASRLSARGVRVWLDRSELRIGDSLRERIDEGLLKSTFGIVIVSPGFFSRYWTRTELDGLVQRESGNRKIVLPVWHRVTVEDVARFSPVLAGRIAARTADGLDSVAEAVTREVTIARSASINPSAFEGIWKATTSHLLYCLKFISGELRVGFGDGSAIRGQCYECRIVGQVLLCRFERVFEKLPSVSALQNQSVR